MHSSKPVPMASEGIGVWKRLSRKATKHLLESLERGGPEVPELGAPGFQDGGHGAISAAPASDGRSPLTSLPEGVMAKIVSLLDEDEKADLALCCKATLPILWMGHVRVTLDEDEEEKRALLRLQALSLTSVSLEGSADGFLTAGWTALTSLSFISGCAAEDNMCSALQLPVLEFMFYDRDGFRHQGGLLQLNQLMGSCPRLTYLQFSLEGASEASSQSCRFSDLIRLANLRILDWPAQANPGLDLPASLSKLMIWGQRPVDLYWLLLKAEKCIRGGAQLRSLNCQPAKAPLQPEEWAASLDEQFRRMGGRLCGLQELLVSGEADIPLQVAFSAVVSSAPHLSCAELRIEELLPRMELLICSANLEKLTVGVGSCSGEPPKALVLAFLPGCKLLREVRLRFIGVPAVGTTVKIRCHSCSPTCIVPLDPHAPPAGFCAFEVGVQLLPGPPAPHGVQE